MIKTTRACLLLPLLLMACQGPQKQASTPRTLLPQSLEVRPPTVQVNGQPLTSGVTLQPGDTITITVPSAPPVVVTPPPVSVPTPPAPIPVPPTPNVAGTWAPLATEGKTFTLSNPSRVRYGLGEVWNVKDNLVGTLTCGNGVFGDPAVGQTKVCELFVPSVTEAAPSAPLVYNPPLTITKGGTYTGAWESLDANTPAVLVKTGEPVTIENCTLRGKGILIKAPWVSAQLTVRGCTGLGLNPDDVTRIPGRFVHAEGFNSVTIERNALINTAGIYLNAWAGSNAAPVIVRYNRARDIEGRYSDGKSGFQDKFYRVQFLQLNAVKNAVGVDIGWNRIDNTARKSHVEDTINLYASSGTAASPIRVHDNLINGAFGTPPSGSYSGGGIMLGDGKGEHQEAVKNTVLEASNYGIAVAGGNNMRVLDNVALGTGQLPDGTLLDADPDAGFYGRNYSKETRDASTVLFQNNYSGWGRPKKGQPDARWDYSLNPKLVTSVNNLSAPKGPITPGMLAEAVANWEERARAAGLSDVGGL
ncbi:hypothetical protein [Deinococcus humi]|uniref:Right handed beta helix domain-containing protein n=1 Tax=Deinococcus humi TaxID=662880 RepID=A0A7W8ND76_9DEIO|nr:hypothetical protein [Deinococcus humi]MBB5362056.1 hypothetical protein [Deinococcus humi]GGO22290.1 hypothetical protein GCM10008949_09390 [Deinococcus humi]